MEDWKIKVEKHLKEEAEKERQKLAEQALTEPGPDPLEEIFKAEREAAYKELAETFKCHVCGIPAAIPGRGTTVHSHGEWADTIDACDDWSIPGDLFKCQICEEWTCEQHLHLGICQECASKF